MTDPAETTWGDLIRVPSSRDLLIADLFRDLVDQDMSITIHRRPPEEQTP